MKFLLNKILTLVERSRKAGMDRSNDWAGKTAADLKPDVLLDVGCADGCTLFRYFNPLPREVYGVEGAKYLSRKVEERGVTVYDFDLNKRWPLESDKFDVVLVNQVIEHMHNTKLFVMEIYRILKPGGTAVLASENLCSLMNCIALVLGYTPFSLMQTCGCYLGNPLGQHYCEPLAEPVPMDHPAYSGITSHNRVMTVRQAKELFELVGFEVEVSSISILPLPDRLSQVLEKVIKNRGHYLLIKARKPHMKTVQT